MKRTRHSFTWFFVLLVALPSLYPLSAGPAYAYTFLAEPNNLKLDEQLFFFYYPVLNQSPGAVRRPVQLWVRAWEDAALWVHRAGLDPFPER